MIMTNAPLERDVQKNLIKWLNGLPYDIVVLKITPITGIPQGFPDVVILARGTYIVVEVKRDKTSRFQANQAYYNDKLGKMAHAFVYNPQNAVQVRRSILSILRRRYRR